LGVYILHAEQFAAINTGAGLSRFVPGMGSLKIRSPKWPCSALVGASRVDPAAFFPVFRFQEDTVSGARLLDNGRALANAFEIESAEFIRGQFESLCDKFDLRLGDPDESFFRAGTAVSATCTFEMQASCIPGYF